MAAWQSGIAIYRNSWTLPLKSLMDWARAEGLLQGQTNRAIEDALRNLRNLAAHPHGPLMLSPGESARAIWDVAEITNRLWGHETASGRLYGTPIPMELFALQRTPDDSQMRCRAQRLPDLPEHDRAGRWFLIEAAQHDDLFAWHPDYEMTAYPTALIWSGDSWDGAVLAWQEYQRTGRKPEPRQWRDRLFLACWGRNGNEPCRTPDSFLALSPSSRDVAGMHWRIIRADHPGNANTFMQLLMNPGMQPRSAAQQSLVEDVGDFASWQNARKRLMELLGKE